MKIGNFKICNLQFAILFLGLPFFVFFVVKEIMLSTFVSFVYMWGMDLITEI